MNQPTRSEPFNNLLAEVATFMEVQRVRLIRLLSKVALAEIFAIPWLAVFQRTTRNASSSAGTPPAASSVLRISSFSATGTMMKNPGLPVTLNRATRAIPTPRWRHSRSQVQEPRRSQNIRRLWSFHGDCRERRCEVLQRDIVRDDELVEMFQQFLQRFRFRVEQERILSAQHVHIRQNSSLGCQEERIAPRSGVSCWI